MRQMRLGIVAIAIISAIVAVITLGAVDSFDYRAQLKVWTDYAKSVTAASGSSASFDTEGHAECGLEIELTALSGGAAPAVDFKAETSTDNANWAIFYDPASCSAACDRSDFTKRSLHRFLRVSWVTTGAPATATADLAFSCAKRDGATR